MIQSELLALHEGLCEKARQIMRNKNHDYAGDADPFANFRLTEHLGLAHSEVGLLVRMCDKLSRLATYARCGRLDVVGESVEDTCLDMINYVVLLVGLINDSNDRGVNA